MTRRILNLCAGTGAWTRPYEAAGYEVICVTLPDADVRTYEPPEDVHGIVASPPCTEFSVQGGARERDFNSGLEIVDACLRIIRMCQLRSDRLAWWAVENPRGFLRQFLGKPALSCHYWWYGDSLDKPTDVWGYFNLPKRVYSEPPVLLKFIQDFSNWDGQASIERAVTPPGFAQAFFEANP